MDPTTRTACSWKSVSIPVPAFARPPLANNARNAQLLLQQQQPRQQPDLFAAFVRLIGCSDACSFGFTCAQGTRSSPGTGNTFPSCFQRMYGTLLGFIHFLYSFL